VSPPDDNALCFTVAVESAVAAVSRHGGTKADVALQCMYTVVVDCKLCSACTAGISSSGATTSVFVATTKRLCSDAKPAKAAPGTAGSGKLV
jgi:hypothetical protein